MRRLLCAVLALACACAAPRPCTRTLCPTRIDGEVSLKGYSGTVRVTPDVPKPAVPSDAEVSVVSGSAEFVNGKTLVRAGAGASFRFFASTAAWTSLTVTSGSVEVVPSTGAATSVPAGSSFVLPKAK